MYDDEFTEQLDKLKFIKNIKKNARAKGWRQHSLPPTSLSRAPALFDIVYVLVFVGAVVAVDVVVIVGVVVVGIVCNAKYASAYFGIRKPQAGGYACRILFYR